MRKIVSWLLAIALSCILSNTALANTFAGGIPKEIPYTYEGITYDRYVVLSQDIYDICHKTVAVYFVSSEMTTAGYPTEGYYYSLVRGPYVPLFISGPDGSHTAIFRALDNQQGVCAWPEDAIPDVSPGVNGFLLRGDKPEAIHDHNFDLYTRSWFDAPLPYTFTGDFASWGTWYDGLLDGNASFGFPIPQDKNGNPFTPYTAPVSSVMDQSTLGAGTPYDDSDHYVMSFEGEVGDQGPYPGSTCYAKSNGKAFGKTINYKGTSVTDGKYYLCYNGHPGYDYPFVKGTPIHAATVGTLCVATNKTAPDGTSLWRNQEHCPLSKVGGTNWGNCHAFYIIHKGLFFNGSSNDYMTVYLHSNSLAPDVENTIRINGYKSVMDGEYVADVGKVCTDGNHMHFEVYKWDASEATWDRIDPYGDGVDNILWRR